MTEQDAEGARTAAGRRNRADALVRAVERCHEVLDSVAASEDYDAAIDTLADLLDTSTAAAEDVLRLSFGSLTRVGRRRILSAAERLASESSDVSAPEQDSSQEAGSARRLMLRPFSADRDRDIFAARTVDVRSAGDGTSAPAGDLTAEIRAAVARVAAEESAWLVAEVGTAKVGMVFGDLVDGEVGVRIWIHPDHRKQGYGTAALRASRTEMAAYFPAVPLVVRAPAAGA